LKNSHINTAQDRKLLETIYDQVDNNLNIDPSQFKRAVWTKFVIYFILTTLSYSLLYLVSSPIWFVLVYLLYGFAALLLAFNFSHDFSHNTVFKSKKLNHFCFICIYAFVGAHGEAWKERHIKSHHHAPNVEGHDSDLKISKLIRVIPKSKHYWFHKYQHIYAPLAYTTYSLFWIFIKDFNILYSKDDFRKNKGVRYHLSFWMQKFFYVGISLVLPMLFSGHAWYVVVFGFLGMHLSQSLFLLFTFFMTHHVENTLYPTTDANGKINTSWVMNQIKSSNDMNPFSEATNFILGGFNCHIAHHLFPHVHHIHYPKLNKILYEILNKHGIIPNQTTYFGGITSHLRLLKQMSVK